MPVSLGTVWFRCAGSVWCVFFANRRNQSGPALGTRIRLPSEHLFLFPPGVLACVRVWWYEHLSPLSAQKSRGDLLLKNPFQAEMLRLRCGEEIAVHCTIATPLAGSRRTVVASEGCPSPVLLGWNKGRDLDAGNEGMLLGALSCSLCNALSVLAEAGWVGAQKLRVLVPPLPLACGMTVGNFTSKGLGFPICKMGLMTLSSFARC